MAGQKLTKQHTVDDFVASAEWLISHRYTTPRLLSGEGTSAGGILIGGALTQHPRLFSSVWIFVGDPNVSYELNRLATKSSKLDELNEAERFLVSIEASNAARRDLPNEQADWSLRAQDDEEPAFPHELDVRSRISRSAV